MKFNVHVSIEFVPLPVEQEPMWDEAMQILTQWMMEIDLSELQDEGSRFERANDE